jgi:hypothetical protein
MNTRPENKLRELRSKTDRQLVQLIAGQLDHVRTRRACEEIRLLLRYVPKVERRRLEKRLEEVGEHLPALAGCCC